MSKPLFDLQKLLATPQTVRQGTVVGVLLDVVSISSPFGMKSFRVANPGTYQTGDRVRFQGEVFLGKMADEAGIPQYSV